VTYFHMTPSPVGDLLLLSDGDALTGLYLNGTRPPADAVVDAEPFGQAVAELAAYFAGTLTTFTVSLAPRGTPFQVATWELLRGIPFGETISYAEQARRLGRPTASRAVGAANGKNPLCLVLPCHRVIGANGSLTGYGGGLPRKKWMLDFEARAGL
jgi:methylated-DNA-[protein]-cysteine S-methyltransferase